MSFERVSVVGSIKGVLSQYPFGAPLFREFLQNSDDAQADTQIFIVDYRNHSTENITQPDLVDTKGPALLAINNKTFSSADWHHIILIQDSSKRLDTSKIGKYGLGFRSCYHVTDNPQILSGGKLKIFDPCHHAFAEGGCDFDVDQCSMIDQFLPDSLQGQYLEGTMIRLPLRSSKTASISSLNDKAIEPSDIRQLLDQFISGEINQTLLFLSYITSIKIFEIDDYGSRQLAGVEIVRDVQDCSGFPSQDANVDTYRAVIKLSVAGTEPQTQSWRILRASFPEELSNKLLRGQFEADILPVLEKHKLLPNVGLAYPLSSSRSPGTTIDGRLFTFLPLPMRTEFPCHVHALFALNQDRQGLKHGDDEGLSEKSDDRVLIRWNKLLFETFIPSAWAMLLSTLLDRDGIPDIFQAWPPLQSFVDGSDSEYRHTMPRDVLKAVLETDRAVWPVMCSGVVEDKICIQTPSIFSDLGSLIVAPAKTISDDDSLLAALTIAGVNITQPPAYIADCLEHSQAKCQFMTPAVVHRWLKVQTDNISSLGHHHPAMMCILDYLLSTDDIDNIACIPIVPLIDGSYAALTLDDSAPSITRTLLTDIDSKIFGHVDPTAVAINAMLPKSGKSLLEKGPDRLNVVGLAVEGVLKYLHLVFDRFGLALNEFQEQHVSPKLINWLTSFWDWVVDSQLKFFQSMLNICLLPTSINGLRSPNQGVFSQPSDLHVFLLDGFHQIGTPFLHPQLSQRAQAFLKSQGAIREVTSIHHILDAATTPAGGFDNDTAEHFRNHFASCLSASRRQFGPLSEEQIAKFRCLPIFPALIPPSSRKDGCTLRMTSIPDGQIIITGVVDTPILPVIHNRIFIAGCGALLEHLQNGAKVLNITEILTLFIDHVTTQPKHLQQALIDYIYVHHDDVSRGLLSSLSEKSFVAVRGGNAPFQPPKDVFDPECPAAKLFQDDGYCANISSDDDRAIISGLRSLRLLKVELDKGVIEERMLHISRCSNIQAGASLARCLLQIVVATNYDCSNLKINLDLRWLPTKDHLHSSRECHHSNAHPSEFFDECLPVVEVETLSVSLMTALQWDKPIPVATLKSQLGKVIQHNGMHDKLLALIRELSFRELSHDDHNDLRTITCHRPWIPISQECTATTSRAIISKRLGEVPGFYAIPSILIDVDRIRKFLKEMGCTERPSSTGLIEELASLEEPDRVYKSLRLLELLASQDFGASAAERWQIVVPNHDGHLKPINQVYFNDLGAAACEIDIPEDLELAHPKLDFELAKSLRVTFLSHSGLKPIFIDEDDMGEMLTTRIQNALKYITIEQVIGELLENADNANATVFGILLNDLPAASTHTHVLSPALDELQSHPSLIIHNDSVFDDNDFKSIMHAGIGGKQGRPDTTGQFGLGALSMYHFSEVAMIVSGDKVMMLDPSKRYIPFKDRVAVLLKFSDVKRRYVDHLAPLCGLYGFSLDLDDYDGTLFWLPLRTSRSSICERPITMYDIRMCLEGPWRATASQALLFTRLKSIKAEHRDTSGSLLPCWSIKCTSDVPYGGEICRSQILRIIEESARNLSVETEWLLLSRNYPRDTPSLREEFQQLTEQYRIRDPVMVGIAANLTSTMTDHNFFATMPLPILTRLPVHLNATFILAQDKREIPLDAMDIDGQINLPSSFNAQLLSSFLPPIYTCLLEELGKRWVHHRGDEDRWKWWPGTSLQDAKSLLFTGAFYSEHAPSTNMKICISVHGTSIAPKDATFLENDISAESKILLYLRPVDLVFAPQDIRRALGDKMAVVGPGYVRRVILQYAERVRSAFEEQHITIADINDVVRYLVTESEELIMGLPLLPLADASLATFKWSGDDKCYYAWKSSREDGGLFPQDRLIDSRFSTAHLDRKFNVSKLDGAGVQVLVEGLISMDAQREGVSAVECAGIDCFWSEYGEMGLETDAISNLTVVRTTTPNSFISLQRCISNDVIIVNTTVTASQEIAEILCCLGAIAIPSDLCHSSLRKILEGKDYHRLSVVVILQFLSSLGSSLHQRFYRLSDCQRTSFAQWCKDKFTSSKSAESPQAKTLLPVMRSLPIWPNLESTVDGPFLPASDLRMLPPAALGHEECLLRFLRAPSNFTYYSSILHSKFNETPLKFDSLRDHLDLSRRSIFPHEIKLYKSLLTMLTRNYASDSRGIKVPNHNLVLENAGAIYARQSEPLFLQAFQTDLQRIIHPEFQDQERELAQFGLRTTMDFESFRDCIIWIDKDVDGSNRVERARHLYRWYCEVLPIALAGGPSERWRQLESFRFIPPSSLQQSVSYERLGYVRRSIRALDLVAPNEVFLPEHERIIWSQRAPFLPSDRLRLGDLALGVPTAVEVLKHLSVLALEVAPNNPSNGDLLSDITATYQWLEEHVADDQLINNLVQRHAERLFLNVDDPKQAEWVWRSADELCFNISDLPHLSCWGVRDFLQPFQGILRGVGVGKVEGLTIPKVSAISFEDRFSAMLASFDGMRRQGILIDVKLIAKDGEEFLAHRAFLATTSRFFQDLFCSQFKESQPATAENPIIISTSDSSAQCLGRTIEFLYTGLIPQIENQDELMEILILAHYWEIKRLFEHTQSELLSHINLANYNDIRLNLQEYTLDPDNSPDILLNGCNEFERLNRAEISRFQGISDSL